MTEEKILLRRYNYKFTRNNKIIPEFNCNRCGYFFKKVNVFIPIDGKLNVYDDIDLCPECTKGFFENNDE